jgi:hypothetical protein
MCLSCLWVGLWALLVLWVGPSARAQDENGFSMTVSPARLDVVPAAGESIQKVRAANTGTEPLHVEVTITEFRQLEEGQIVFETQDDPLSAVHWLDVGPLSFDLAPGDERHVRIHVSVPDQAEPGERQVAVLFTVEAGETQGNIRLNRTIASELLINVPGRTVEESAFGDLDSPWFADAGPIPLTLEVRNLGNIHRDYIQPDHLVAQTSTGQTVPFPPFTVLRDSKRLIETQWPDPPLACICTITVESDDGRGNLIRASARVIVFPLRFVLGIVIAAGGLFMLTRGGVRRRRKATDERIDQARREAYEEARREVESAKDQARREGPQEP